jgi:hypothetical protein
MVTLRSIVASGANTTSVIAEINSQIRAQSAAADFVYAFYGCDHDDHAKCMLAVGERMAEVASEIVDSFTFGEQGSLIDRNMHGNLMISAVAFGQ